MTKEEVRHVKWVLEKIKEPDGNVKKAIAICDKQLATYEACKGQLRNYYQSEY